MKKTWGPKMSLFIYVWVRIAMATVIILMVAYFVNSAHSAEPQSTVIEFTSAEDLQVRVDSVIGVCDTTGWETIPIFEPIDWYNPDVDSGRVEYVDKPIVRCRTLVDVEVIPRDWFSEPMGSDWDGFYTAIVWWEWEVE